MILSFLVTVAFYWIVIRLFLLVSGKKMPTSLTEKAWSVEKYVLLSAVLTLAGPLLLTASFSLAAIGLPLFLGGLIMSAITLSQKNLKYRYAVWFAFGCFWMLWSLFAPEAAKDAEGVIGMILGGFGAFLLAAFLDLVLLGALLYGRSKGWGKPPVEA